MGCGFFCILHFERLKTELKLSEIYAEVSVADCQVQQSMQTKGFICSNNFRIKFLQCLCC